MSKHVSILAFTGSLRRESVNTAILKTAMTFDLDDVDVTLYDYTDVPFYNADVDTPKSVEGLRSAIESADAVLFASPEYNYSVSGVLKNAIDWASRPTFDSCFVHKPVGIVSASPALTGGARGQQHLKGIVLAMAGQVAPLPEFAMGRAYGKVDGGVITDSDSVKRLEEWMGDFVAWVRRVS